MNNRLIVLLLAALFSFSSIADGSVTHQVHSSYKQAESEEFNYLYVAAIVGGMFVAFKLPSIIKQLAGVRQDVVSPCCMHHGHSHGHLE